MNVITDNTTKSKIVKNEISYQWQTSRGAAAMSFTDEARARRWHADQKEAHGDRMVPMKLVKVINTVIHEELA